MRGVIKNMYDTLLVLHLDVKAMLMTNLEHYSEVGNAGPTVGNVSERRLRHGASHRSCGCRSCISVRRRSARVIFAVGWANYDSLSRVLNMPFGICHVTTR